MELSIVIPAHTDRRILNCIESIDEDVEIVVVLNRPSKEVREIVNQNSKNLTVVEIDEANLGKAYNTGINESLHKNVLLMDSDCVFSPGTILTLYQGLQHAPLSKGRVIFKSNNFLNRLVAESRSFHISGFVNAYSPPLAFRKDIVKEIGYYFDNDVHWSEDFDFDQRVRKARLKIAYFKNATVQHPELSILADLRSAFRYGIGHQIGVEKGIFSNKSISIAERAKRVFRLFHTVRNKMGFWTASYMMLWNTTFKAGTYTQTFFDVYKVRNKYTDLKDKGTT